MRTYPEMIRFVADLATIFPSNDGLVLRNVKWTSHFLLAEIYGKPTIEVAADVMAELRQNPRTIQTVFTCTKEGA